MEGRSLLGVQEVPSSNLGGPTKFLNDLQTTHLPIPSIWGPNPGLRQPGPPSMRKTLFKFLAALSSWKNLPFPTFFA